jgi:hypothetical protein
MVNEKMGMMPPAEQPDEEQKDIEGENSEADSIKKFNTVFSSGNFDDAERILNEEKFGAKEKEKLQRLLFQSYSYYEMENWEGVVRIINATEDPFSQKGRINRFRELAGEEKFKELENQIERKKISSSEGREIVEIKSTSDFRELLKQKDYDRAQEWIDKIINEGVYKDLTGAKFNNFINDRKRDIRQAKEGEEE